ncbi:Ig-like domain-containing protein [Microbulbifer sp. SA54]|uniref:Ig-like domain-containing protein n=1 Tax=Microbulbifer sp. SA54 TaxID=3401577 RepID=UPI003AAB727F
MKPLNIPTCSTLILSLFVTSLLSGCGGGGGGSGDAQPQPVEPAPTNGAPAAVDDRVSMLDRDRQVTIDVLANDTDEDGDTLAISTIEESAQGVTATIVDGKIRYEAPADFTGEDTFTYSITDGALQASASVTVVVSPGMSVTGKLGESRLASANVEVRIAGDASTTSYRTRANNGAFQLNIPLPADDSVVIATATLDQAAPQKPIVFRSYLGAGAQLKDAALDYSVSEGELATLYLSAASTSAAALIERAAGQEILSREKLIAASQILPQDLLMENAITLKSLLAGDQWPEFTQTDSYALLQDFPAAIAIAESLKTSDSAKYESYRTSVLQDENQSQPLALQPYQELVFIEGPSSIRRPYGFAIQLSNTDSNAFYLAENIFHKSGENLGTFTSSAGEINLSIEGLFPELRDAAHSVENCPADANGYHRSIAVARDLRRYLETPVFAAFTSVETYKCITSGETYALPPRYYQVNNFTHGDFSGFLDNAFAISSYRDLDSNTYTVSSRWQTTVSTANAAGGFTQRFDIKHGYTDTATGEVLENGRLLMVSGRGDTIEYIPVGYDGAGLRTIALLKRDDGSLASMGGDMVIPVVTSSALTTPIKLVYKDSPFSVVSPTSAYHDLSFGFDFRTGGNGSDLERTGTNFMENGNGFTWSDQGSHLELHYYYDRDTQTYMASCPTGASNCEEYRFREFELLYEENGEYYIRVHNETDLSKQYSFSFSPNTFLYSYVDRFVIAQ